MQGVSQEHLVMQHCWQAEFNRPLVLILHQAEMIADPSNLDGQFEADLTILVSAPFVPLHHFRKFLQYSSSKLHHFVPACFNFCAVKL